MEQLIQLLQQSFGAFNIALVEVGATEYQQQQKNQMEIQNQPLNQPDGFDAFPNSQFTLENQWKFFDKLSDNAYSQTLDSKIANIKMNSVSLRRKDELFKRHKRQQQQKIVQRRKQLQQKYEFNVNQLKFQGEFNIRKNGKNEIFAFKSEDFEKLRPETDLNDTVMDNYLKLMQATLLSQDLSKKTFIFSTFFMGKLLGQLKQDTYFDRDSENTLEKVLKKVTQGYQTMKRWTKRHDLFAHQYLVIPINAFKHWNCMIIISPHALLTQPNQCKIFYLDSMFEKKSMFSQAIKTYLQLELYERKNIKMSLQNVPTYQLLVPRQTNTHDCGLYTLCYIEYLLKSHEILQQNMDVIDNRYQLKIFPRSLIFTMRELLRRLFRNLLLMEDKDLAIQDYVKLREEIQKNSIEADYDSINQRQFKKYYRLNSHLLEDKKKKQSEIEYQCKVKFYLDCQINHYQKDQTI